MSDIDLWGRRVGTAVLTGLDRGGGKSDEGGGRLSPQRYGFMTGGGHDYHGINVQYGRFAPFFLLTSMYGPRLYANGKLNTERKIQLSPTGIRPPLKRTDTKDKTKNRGGFLPAFQAQAIP